LSESAKTMFYRTPAQSASSRKSPTQLEPMSVTVSNTTNAYREVRNWEFLLFRFILFQLWVESVPNTDAIEGSDTQHIDW